MYQLFQNQSTITSTKNGLKKEIKLENGKKYKGK